MHMLFPTCLLVSLAPIGIVRDVCLGRAGVRVSGFSSSCVETSGKSLCWCESISLLGLVLQPEGLCHLKCPKLAFWEKSTLP